ncbi:MAG: ATP synthase F1 subunit delta [Isosphaeraceae bacterium]
MSHVDEPMTPPVPSRAYDEVAAELARTYATALINAAEKENCVDDALEELEAVRATVLERYPPFAEMMRSPVRSTAEKDRILTQVFDGKVMSINLRFLRVLNRHGRLSILGPVLQEAVALWNTRQNRRSVLVKSAKPLDASQTEALSARLAKALNATPILRLEIDPGLIGGLVIQVGDDVYDASVRNRLEQLRNRLIQGKTHEIQSRRDYFSHPE